MSTTVTLNELADIFALEAIKGFGPQKFKEIHEAGLKAGDILARPYELQRFGKRGSEFRRQVEELGAAGRQSALSRAKKQMTAASSANGQLLTYDSKLYPATLYESNNPVPVLYARGNAKILSLTRAVACVGSRNIRAPYSTAHERFAVTAVREGLAVVSGFATGADIIGHLAAESTVSGRTVCVMPSGLDRPFPPEHRDIWRRLLESTSAVFVSEFGFGVGANSLNLRKRNKTIVGLSNGVLVSQSADDGGAMNAYRFAIEQKKPIATFRSDGTSETSGNDLIAGSAEKVRFHVLSLNDETEWLSWLRAL